MRIRYVPADPAGNLTALALTPVPATRRAAVAARMMALCPEGFEQVGFADEGSMLSPLPRMAMMGGEFCGNAARAFALLAAQRRGLGETALCVSVSGASAPVRVTFSGRQAFAKLPLPVGTYGLRAAGRDVPVVCMEGIDHALLLDCPPSEETARAVLAAMRPQDAQGVLFVQGGRMTPMVAVTATDTCVWESSCGSGTLALGWHLAQGLPDGAHAFAFDEPGGRLVARVQVAGGHVRSAQMGGEVTLGEERSIEI